MELTEDLIQKLIKESQKGYKFFFFYWNVFYISIKKKYYYYFIYFIFK